VIEPAEIRGFDKFGDRWSSPPRSGVSTSSATG